MKELALETVQIVKKAGEILKKEWQERSFEIFFKQEKEIVTEIDLKVERFLKENLEKIFFCQFTGEESFSEKTFNEKRFWLVDPIDGTLNFCLKIPWIAISVALVEEGEPALGVVYNPILDECFYAWKKGGAFLNGEKINTVPISLEESIWITSLNKRCKRHNFEMALALFKEIEAKTGGTKKFGAAAFDLCYVACGRLHGFWEIFFKPWDVAGGFIILKEAGGDFFEFNGKKGSIFSSTLVAGHSELVKKALPIFKKFASFFEKES